MGASSRMMQDHQDHEPCARCGPGADRARTEEDREITMSSLTERVAKAAKPGKARFTIYDEKVAGLGLRVEPSGLKSFIVRYRSNGGGRGAPERLVVIGRYGVATMTVEQARQEAGR